MKKLIYLLFVTTLFISCEKDSNDEVIETKNLTSITYKGTSGIVSKSLCVISGPTIVTPNTIVEYTFNSTAGYTFNLAGGSDWAITTGGTSLGTTQVQIGPAFTCGEVKVISNDGCITSLFVSTTSNIDNCACPGPPPAPEAIDSRFGTPVPPGYVQGNLGGNSICTNTIDNTLSVPLDSCSSYSWSITPSGTHLATILPSRNEAVVIIKQPGEYVVRLVTSNNAGQRTEQYVLFAENCNGGGIGGF